MNHDEHWDQTIAALQQEITRKEEELIADKRAANRVCATAKRPPIYPDTELTLATSIATIRRDQWYGQPISTAVREYLAMRRAQNQGPASVAEIYDALLNGGYAFDAKDAENAKRALRISLTKNSSVFHRLPDGKTYGLLEWYPEAKLKKAKEPAADDEQDGEDDDNSNGSADKKPPLLKAKVVHDDSKGKEKDDDEEDE